MITVIIPMYNTASSIINSEVFKRSRIGRIKIKLPTIMTNATAPQEISPIVIVFLSVS